MSSRPENQLKAWLIVSAIFLLLAGLLFSIGPIPQSHEYHHFSDNIHVLSIPNGLNVLSNIPFLLIGIAGLATVSRVGNERLVEANRIAYQVFFLAVALIAPGSSYYHWAPSNETLFWDRLPMAAAFMAIVVGEMLSVRWGVRLLAPLVVLGAGSVVYWYFTEMRGMGDLRPYLLVQFFPILMLPWTLLRFPPRFTRLNRYWWLWGYYLVAKLLESFDEAVQDLIMVSGGHALKHLFAALGVWFLLSAIRERRRLQS